MSQLEAHLQLLSLDRLPRTGWLMAGVPAPESVAAHSLGTALVAVALGPSVAPPLDVDRAVTLAVLHDVPEAWLGDLPRRAARLLPAGAKASAEAIAAEGLLGPLSELALARHRELREDTTREARFVRLCDKLHLGIRLVGYLRAGARSLEEFTRGLVELDCGEFAPCEDLRREILAAVESTLGS